MGSTVASMTTAIAVGALIGGAGAAAMAGISSGVGVSSMTKGSVDVTMSYDETIVGTMLMGNNINVKSNNSITMISADITVLNDLNIEQNNNLTIETAEEKHESSESHSSFGRNIGKAALGGAITGLASGLEMQGGEIAGNFTGNAINNAIGGATGNILGATTGAAVNASAVSLSNITGTAMSQVTIQGGSFSDVLKAGKNVATDKNTLKSVAIASLTVGMTTSLTTGLTNCANTATNGAISTGNAANATFSQQLTSSLYESAISTTTSTAIQSAINRDSFTNALKNQGLNTIAGALGNLGAKQIGGNYHGGNNDKPIKAELKAYNFVTPNREDYIMNENVSEFYNAYNKNDILAQDIFGGTDTIVKTNDSALLKLTPNFINFINFIKNGN
jgi:hypothetical protein